MASKLEWTKTGLRIACNVQTTPAPQPRQTYPIPTIPIAATSLLTLAIADVDGSYRKGIRIVSRGGDWLPSGSKGVWSLRWAWWQTVSPPTILAWEQMTIPRTKLDLTIHAVPDATYLFRLRKVEGGRTTDYPTETIATPADGVIDVIGGLSGSIDDLAADGKFTPVKKSAVRMEWGNIVADLAIMDAQATTFGIVTEKNTYDAKFQALANYLNAGATWTTGIPDWITDAHLGTTTTITPATFRTKFNEYYDSKTALNAAIAAVTKAIADGHTDILDAINDPDVLARSAKPELLIRYNTELQVQTDLDAKAATLSVSPTAYDNAVAAVTTFLQNLGGSSPNWAYLDMTTDTGLGTGGAASLRTLWNTVASTRAALQSAIAGAYPAYRIAADATDAMRKAVFTTANKIRGDLLVDGSLFSKSMVVANTDNLIPNPNSILATGPTGSYEIAGLVTGVPSVVFSSPVDYNCRRLIWTAGQGVYTPIASFPVHEGEKYYVCCDAGFYGYIENYCHLIMIFDKPGSSWFASSQSQNIASYYTNPTPTKLEIFATVPAGATTARIAMHAYGSAHANAAFFNNFYCRRCNDANLLVDGILTALMARAETMESPDYSTTNGTTPGSGFKIAGNPFLTTPIDGGTEDVSAEFGDDILIAGYRAVTVANKIFNNSVKLTGSGNWTCPPGVTRVEVLAVGSGGNGAKHASGGGGGGGGAAIRTIVAVTPGTAYAYVVGTGGAGSHTTFAVGGINARAGSNASGTTGGSASGPVFSDSNGVVVDFTGVIPHGASGAITSTIEANFLAYGAGGGSTSESGGSVGPYSGGSHLLGGGGGASGFGKGGNGGSSASGTTPAGYGGGGGGTATGASAGVGAPGTIILRW